MHLFLDVGNTSISFAAPRAGKLSPVGRVSSRPEGGGVWEEAFSAALAESEGAVLASVNPPASERLERWLREARPGLEVLAAGRDFPIPVRSRARIPGEVGADRLLNVLAAFRRLGRSSIVVDLGTATTFDLVSAEGDYLGGAIAPGLSLCFTSLHAYTALLPGVSLQEPAAGIGRDTVSCMRIGVVEGYRGLVRHLVERFRGELGADTPVLVTGGEGSWVACALPGAQVVPSLTLEGLQAAYLEWKAAGGKGV